MKAFRFLFTWSLQITGTLYLGYNYMLKPQQQANLYGMYRSGRNSFRACKEINQALKEYKSISDLSENSEEYNRKLQQINLKTAHRIYDISRTNQGVYMRLGQYLGNLKQAYPKQISQTLSQLNRTPNYQTDDYKYVKKDVEILLGKSTRELFESLNTNPIHTDLFYQVYRGELLQNFLDVNMKIIRPYSKSEAEWDFWFLKKAASYINNFKQKNFKSNQLLFLDLLLQNLKNSVDQELNLKNEEQTMLEIKQKFEQSVPQIKPKIATRSLPIYIPHIYSKYTSQRLLISEYFEGYHLSNITAAKETFNIKNISTDIVTIWNKILTNNSMIVESYIPSHILVRNSRSTEEGPYKICPLNFTQVSKVPQFWINPYNLIWKELIENKKINTKNPEERIQSIKFFYENLPSIYFRKFLQDKEAVIALGQKSNIGLINDEKLRIFEEINNIQIPKNIVKKLEEKKIISNSKAKDTKSYQKDQDYSNLKKAFEIEYQPWKFGAIFNTYRQVFKQQQNFGLV